MSSHTRGAGGGRTHGRTRACSSVLFVGALRRRATSRCITSKGRHGRTRTVSVTIRAFDRGEISFALVLRGYFEAPGRVGACSAAVVGDAAREPCLTNLCSITIDHLQRTRHAADTQHYRLHAQPSRHSRDVMHGVYGSRQRLERALTAREREPRSLVHAASPMLTCSPSPGVLALAAHRRHAGVAAATGAGVRTPSPAAKKRAAEMRFDL